MKYLKNLNIRTKLLSGYSIITIVVIMLGSIFLYSIIKDSIEAHIESELKNSTAIILNMVRTVAKTSIKVHLGSIAGQNKKIVKEFYNLYKRGILTEQQAKNEAGKKLLQRKIGKTGYIFVWDIAKAPESIPLAVHPVIQGKDVAYVDFVQTGARIKNGYIEYKWANPGDKKKRKKSMYLTYFKPWQWVIAASSYKEEFLDLVSADDFREAIMPLHFGKSGYSFIIDVKGNVIIHPKVTGNFYNTRDADGFYFIKEICKKKNGKIVYRWKNPSEKVARMKLAVYNYLPEFDWIVASSGYHEEFYKPLKYLLNTIIAISVISLILILSLSIIIGSSITRPIYSLIERFSIGSKGDFSTRMEIKSNDEIGELSRFFNKFMEQLEKYSSELKDEIKERKQASEELSAEKERLMITLSSIGEGVITTDKDGKVIIINRVAEKIIECEHDEVINDHINNVVTLINGSKEIPLDNPVLKVIETGRIIELEDDIKLLTINGLQKSISASVAPIRDSLSNTIGTVFVLRDITERKKMERELNKAAKIESLGVFAGGIAHDFNNLLTVIIGNISLAKESTDLGEDCYNILDDAEKASLNARNLTQQLLTFSKGGEPIKRSASLKKMLRESADFILSGSNIKSEYSITEDIWNANIDIGQFPQVIHNIILNARQAMPDGGTIYISAENFHLENGSNLPLAAGDYIKINILDEGGGVSSEHLKKIFDPYFTTKNDGNGLGLSICYSIITKHNGYITVESDSNKGTKFIIYIPASVEAEVLIEKKTHLKSHGAGKTALIMDDEASVLRAAKRMLERLGFDVICFGDGKEVISFIKDAKINNKPFDVVIMDLTIPGGMGGQETVKFIHEIDPDVKVVVSSGYSNDPVMASYEKHGFCGIIVKPYRFEEMSEMLYKILS